MSINLPIEFTKRMKNLLGDEYEQFALAYEDSNYRGLRINPLKVTHSIDIEEFGVRPVPWCTTGFYYDDSHAPGKHPFHYAGAYYIQEPSAMLVGELAQAKPGMKVLDLCAAPGGKTGHLAGKMSGQGVLVANEIVPSRAKILSQNVERLGIRNCIVVNEAPDKLACFMPGYFDLIVVDAPCSGEGMFRRDEIARDEWSPENVTMCAKRGQDILDDADTMLSMGGRLVYSTCTFAPDEDEKAIEAFIQSHPLYCIEKVDISPVNGSKSEDGWFSKGRPEWTEKGDKTIEDTIRLWPHELHGEGHFVAVLKKGKAEDTLTDSISIGKTKTGKNNKDSKNGKDSTLNSAVKLYEEFAGKNLSSGVGQGEYVMFGSNLYQLPVGAPKIDRVRVERAGLQLGEIIKNRFEPGHALAMALRPEECLRVHNITDNGEAIKYLCGESLSCDAGMNGWCLVTYDNVSLGWGKAVNGQLKNHYPKGIRIKK